MVGACHVSIAVRVKMLDILTPVGGIGGTVELKYTRIIQCERGREREGGREGERERASYHCMCDHLGSNCSHHYMNSDNCRRYYGSCDDILHYP